MEPKKLVPNSCRSRPHHRRGRPSVAELTPDREGGWRERNRDHSRSPYGRQRGGREEE